MKTRHCSRLAFSNVSPHDLRGPTYSEAIVWVQDACVYVFNLQYVVCENEPVRSCKYKLMIG